MRLDKPEIYRRKHACEGLAGGCQGRQGELSDHSPSLTAAEERGREEEWVGRVLDFNVVPRKSQPGQWKIHKSKSAGGILGLAAVALSLAGSSSQEVLPQHKHSDRISGAELGP